MNYGSPILERMHEREEQLINFYRRTRRMPGYKELMKLWEKNSEASYILRVKGESMIEAGIREGDMVIAERGSNANDGDIVIAEVDGGWTMKYFRRRGARIYLEPANIAMQPIYPEEELRIAAIVKAVIRKY